MKRSPQNCCAPTLAMAASAPACSWPPSMMSASGVQMITDTRVVYAYTIVEVKLLVMTLLMASKDKIRLCVKTSKTAPNMNKKGGLREKKGKQAAATKHDTCANKR